MPDSGQGKQKTVTYNFVSCDCGNSSTRVILCRFDGEKITAKALLQKPNEQIKRGGYYYWDIKGIFAYVKRGLALAAREVDKIHSIGICTWGIDFALFDHEMTMLAAPLCYRNTIGKEELDKLSPEERDAMFFRTGILSDRINTVFMLKGIQSKMPDIIARSKKLLMIPDLLNYFFTGRCYSEISEASTTQLFDVRTMQYSREQCGINGISPELFYPVVEHGTLIGNVLPEILKETGITYDIPVVCIPSHDTASAVMGAPIEEEVFLFISAGTWALIGIHCREPVINETVLHRGFTNEAGAFGHITLLKNSIGLFIFQKLHAEYCAEDSREISWDEFETMPDSYEGPPLLFDVNHPDFFNPPCMGKAIQDYLMRLGRIKGPISRAALVSAAYASLAASFAAGLNGVKEISGADLQKAVIVGGGSRDKKLIQLVADISGMEIIAGGLECTSIGNALAQAAYVCRGISYGDLRKIAAASVNTTRYVRNKNKGSLLEEYSTLNRSGYV
ncbi:MAG: carbohydrate kinase [Treponema sp.]|jgi:sugar (pentulose or hexulose) kinase|nr:carbohydrate kinase [Treponema sp.]